MKLPKIDRKFWINVVFFILGGILLFFLYTKYRVPPALGPDMEFTTLEGKKVSLRDFKGKTVFLNFWETWCGPCVQEMPTIEKARLMLDSTKIIFITVAEEDAGKINAFRERHSYGFNYFLSVKKFSELGIHAYPTTYVIDRKGHIAYSSVGGIDWSEGAMVAQLKQIME